ncbi:MAG: isochorismatase family protein [Armatimonadetes bacterium]|nr:isochorismatase family protein [Armatimonadota bacterium]
MSAPRLTPESSVVLVVDIQPKFLASIHENERVLRRAEFLLKVAGALSVPVYATEQNVERMGGTHEALVPLIQSTSQKMVFSAATPEVMTWLKASGRSHVVLVGIETHICVTQTALDLIAAGYGVVLAEDALSASTQARHELGLKRMAAGGATSIHTEALAYEWMATAEHPAFREVLKLVKEAGA